MLLDSSRGCLEASTTSEMLLGPLDRPDKLEPDEVEVEFEVEAGGEDRVT